MTLTQEWVSLSITLNNYQASNRHEVLVEVKDVRKTLLGGTEVLIQASSKWKGRVDDPPMDGWLRIGDTFTITKDFHLS